MFFRLARSSVWLALQLEQVVKQLDGTLESKDKELRAFIVDNKLQAVSNAQPERPEDLQNAGNSGPGLLVG